MDRPLISAPAHSPTAASPHQPHPCRNAPLPSHARPRPSPKRVARAARPAASLSLLLLQRGGGPGASMSFDPHGHPRRPPSSSPVGHPRPQLRCGDGRDPGGGPSVGADLARARGPAPAWDAQLRHGRAALPRSTPSTPHPRSRTPIRPLSWWFRFSFYRGQQLWIRAGGRWSRTGHSSKQMLRLKVHVASVCFIGLSRCCA